MINNLRLTPQSGFQREEGVTVGVTAGLGKGVVDAPGVAAFGFVLAGTLGLLPLVRVGLLPDTGVLPVCPERSETVVMQIAIMLKYCSR